MSKLDDVRKLVDTVATVTDDALWVWDYDPYQFIVDLVTILDQPEEPEPGFAVVIDPLPTVVTIGQDRFNHYYRPNGRAA